MIKHTAFHSIHSVVSVYSQILSSDSYSQIRQFLFLYLGLLVIENNLLSFPVHPSSPLLQLYLTTRPSDETTLYAPQFFHLKLFDGSTHNSQQPYVCYYIFVLW